MTKPIKKISGFGKDGTMTEYFCPNCKAFMNLRINDGGIAQKRKTCRYCDCEIDWRGEI